MEVVVCVHLNEHTHSFENTHLKSEMKRIMAPFKTSRLAVFVGSVIVTVVILKFAVTLLGPTVAQLERTAYNQSDRVPVDSLKQFEGKREPVVEQSSQNAADEDEIRFAERKSHLKDACVRVKSEYEKGVNRGQCEENGVRHHLQYAEESPLLFCLIEKTGCTFWSRVLIVLGGKVKTTNPLDIKTGAAYGRLKDLKSQPFDKIYQVLRSKKKVIFVRDPYSRLLSGYIDKLFNPNPPYWKGMGSKIINNERLLNNESKVTCGYNVTFREFVSHFIKWINSNGCIDGHFSESYRHCHPCEIDFDYIGKMETFKNDTLYILKKLNMTDRVNFGDFEGSADKDAIDDAVGWLFGGRRESEHCVDFKVSMMKVWRRLQMRSIISRNAKFPFLNRNSKEVTKTEFQAAVEKSYFDQSDHEDKKANRGEILREAYSTLSPEQIRDLQKIFKVDLELFGYDPSPEFLRPDPNFKPEFRYMSVDV